MKVYTNKKYYCNKCKIGYNKIGLHNCKHLCLYCKRSNCIIEIKVKCSFCQLNCLNKQCLKIHQSLICSKAKICDVCKERKNYYHVCGNDSKWCGNCKKSVDIEHKCFIQTESQKNQSTKSQSNIKFNGYIFFDYEAYIDMNGYHIPNLVMCQKVCKNCLDKDYFCSQICEKKFFMITIRFVAGYLVKKTILQLLTI